MSFGSWPALNCKFKEPKSCLGPPLALPLPGVRSPVFESVASSRLLFRLLKPSAIPFKLLLFHSPETGHILSTFPLNYLSLSTTAAASLPAFSDRTGGERPPSLPLAPHGRSRGARSWTCREKEWLKSEPAAISRERGEVPAGRGVGLSICLVPGSAARAASNAG